MSASGYVSLIVVAIALWYVRNLTAVSMWSGWFDKALAGVFGFVLREALSDVPAVVRQRSLYHARALGRLSSKRRVRVSMAVLVRVVDGTDVVLITNRKTGQPAALGGALKYFDSARDAVAIQFAAVSSTFAIRGDVVDEEKYRNDLRLEMPLKNIGAFLDWYKTGSGREDYPLRELREELAEAGLEVDEESMLNVGFSRYSTVRTIRWEETNNWYSLMSFEVWEAHLPAAVAKQVYDALDQPPASPKAKASLFRASRSELEHGILEHEPFRGRRLGDNAWALDKGIPLPATWWRE